MSSAVDLPQDQSSGSLGDLLRRAGTQIDAMPVAYRSSDIVAGRYRLIACVGRGGMGEVWRAEHIGLGRTVALKLLSSHRASTDAMRARFAIEARAATRVDHPGSIAVHDVGIDDRGAPFIAMEFVPGQTLASYVGRARRFSPRLAIDLAIQLGETLHAAHEQGVVHRDLKPENILITRRGKRLQTTILDFGLAKLLATAEPMGLTRSGQILGSPSTMSPEQIRGQVVDGRADVYALGCVTYWMLEGKPPFSGDVAALLYAHANTSPPRCTVGTTSHVARKLDGLIGGALAKDAATRPDAAKFVALAKALELTPADPQRSRASRSRVPAMVLALGVAVGAVVAVHRAGSGDAATAVDERGEESGAPASSSTDGKQPHLQPANGELVQPPQPNAEERVAVPRVQDIAPAPAVGASPTSSATTDADARPGAVAGRGRDARGRSAARSPVSRSKAPAAAPVLDNPDTTKDAAAKKASDSPSGEWFDREYERVHGR